MPIAGSREALQEEHFAVAFGRAGGKPHALVTEFLVESGCLKGVAVDSHNSAFASYRFGLGGTNDLRAKASSTVVLAHPQPLDLGVPTPREPIETCDQLTVSVTDEAAERPPVGDPGDGQVVGDDALAQFSECNLVDRVGDPQIRDDVIFPDDGRTTEPISGPLWAFLWADSGSLRLERQ